MRTYEKTHPWINFSLDLRKLEHQTWLLLGEAVSKTEHIAGVPLSPETAQYMHQVYLAKGALATTAIEGNTLNEEDVLKHLNGELQLPPSQEYLTQEIDNIVDAFNLIEKNIIGKKVDSITVNDIKEYNRLVLKKLPLNEDVLPGKTRTHSVVAGRYRGAPAEDCDYLLEKFCDWLNDLDFPKEFEQPYSILTAIAAHIYFVWIHPFGDGNGRTARLIEFRYLLQAGLPTPAAHLLSNFYNLTRAEYYLQLERASQNGGDMNEFIAYATRGIVDQLRQQLYFIRNLQLDIIWRNYIYECFKEKNNKADLRRRQLILELSMIDANLGWVKVVKIPDVSVQLAREYMQKSSKTISRDLNALVDMNLIIRKLPHSVKANKELILAFLPAKVESDND